MLQNLSVQNVVLVDHLELDFRAGFCVLTGETGAGKSILLDALGLALGERSQASLVRQGCDKAMVSAAFLLPVDHPIFTLLQEIGIESTEQLILRRVLYADGRSKAFINDQAISVQTLKQLGIELVEIHGQFDQMLSPKTHLTYFDTYGQLIDKQAQVAKSFAAYADTQQKLQHMHSLHTSKQALIDTLQQFCDDFEKLGPRPNEESSLLAQRQVSTHQQKIVQTLLEAKQVLSTERGIQSLASQLQRLFDKLSQVDMPLLKTLSERIDQWVVDLEEIAEGIQKGLGDCERPLQSLEELDDRLYAIRTFARRHSLTPDELTDTYSKAKDDLQRLYQSDTHLHELETACDQARRRFYDDASQLSHQRRQAIQHFQQHIYDELSPLKLDKVKFDITLTPVDEPNWGPMGIDQLELMIQTNPGTPFGTLQRIASGGERSRLMLAMKVLLASKHHKTILIFDEIDSGVGGAVASAIGERMQRLGQTQQVLAITHSPQVAAHASYHYLIEKHVDNQVTKTRVSTLNDQERRYEIARMLSGEDITSQAQAAADQLLKLAS